MEDSVGRNFDAVLFDLDGTLVDSREPIVASYQHASRAILGRRIEPVELERIIQVRNYEALLILSGGDEAVAGKLMLEFSRAYDEHHERVQLYPGVETTLETLGEAGILLGVVTSRVQRLVEEDFRHMNLPRFFEHVVTGDSVLQAKPDPEPILTGTKALGVSPSRTIYVGDGPNDVIAARAAGASQAGVEFGFHPDEVRTGDPDYMLSSMEDLVPLVLPDQKA